MLVALLIEEFSGAYVREPFIVTDFSVDLGLTYGRLWEHEPERCANTFFQGAVSVPEVEHADVPPARS
jgi:hypothetical protein